MASNSSIVIHKPHVLFVEGKDDFWVCVALLEMLEIESVQVLEIGGFKNLADALKLYTKTPGWSLVERVAVMVDCDGDAEDRTRSVRGSIKKAGLPEPVEPCTFYGEEPAIAYCLVTPSGGCLEDLIRAALSDGGSKADCVDAFVACCGLHDASTSTRHKAWVHAYIAATQPGLKIGEAARAGILALESEPYALIRQLLVTLQNSPAAA